MSVAISVQVASQAPSPFTSPTMPTYYEWMKVIMKEQELIRQQQVEMNVEVPTPMTSVVPASSSPFKRKLIIPTFMKVAPIPMTQEEIVRVPTIIQQEIVTEPTIIQPERITARHDEMNVEVPIPMTQEEKKKKRKAEEFEERIQNLKKRINKTNTNNMNNNKNYENNNNDNNKNN